MKVKSSFIYSLIFYRIYIYSLIVKLAVKLKLYIFVRTYYKMFHYFLIDSICIIDKLKYTREISFTNTCLIFLILQTMALSVQITIYYFNIEI